MKKGIKRRIGRIMASAVLGLSLPLSWKMYGEPFTLTEAKLKELAAAEAGLSAK